MYNDENKKKIDDLLKDERFIAQAEADIGKIEKVEVVWGLDTITLHGERAQMELSIWQTLKTQAAHLRH